MEMPLHQTFEMQPQSPSSHDSMDGVWQPSLEMSSQDQMLQNTSITTFPQSDLWTVPQQSFDPSLETSFNEIFDVDNQQLPTAKQVSFYQDTSDTVQPVSNIEIQTPWIATTNAISQPETSASHRNRAIPKDWERVRPIIERLYKGEHKTLKQVMAIMASQHGHHGTLKMYKSRIKKWNLDKNNKESDMLFILHKRSARGAVGKKTAFQVRGQAVTDGEVERYFSRRRGTRDGTKHVAHTPPHISYRTPSPVSISPPPHLLHLEHLFSSITAYIDGSFSNGTWVSGNGSYRCISSLPRNKNDINAIDFATSCDTAAELFERGLAVQARRVLSWACSLVQGLFMQQDPNCLGEMVNGLLSFDRMGLGDIAVFMLNYLSKMAAEIFTRDLPNHPLAFIWGRLRTVDSNHLELVVIRISQCIHARFETNLGPLHGTTSATYLNYINVRYFDEVVTEERLIRSHIQKLKDSFGESDFRVSVASSYHLVKVLSFQQKYSEAEEIFENMLELAKGEHNIARVAILESNASVQKSRGNVELAEKNLREAEQLACKLLGESDPLALNCLITLESWLREWGRDIEAKEVRIELDRRIGRDEVDEELESQRQLYENVGLSYA